MGFNSMTVSKKAKYNKVINDYGKATITYGLAPYDKKVCTFCNPFANFDFRKNIFKNKYFLIK